MISKRRRIPSPGPSHTTAKLVQKTNEPVPMLYKLPTELRFMIFTYCIASGHPQFMQASRILQEDGQALIAKEGVYRMHFESADDNNGQPPSQEMAKSIQNVKLTVDTANVRFNGAPWMWEKLDAGPCERLKSFVGATHLRGRCHVVLKFGCALELLHNDRLHSPPHKFWGFERLVLRIEIDGTKHNNFAICLCPDQREDFTMGFIRRSLEKFLGKAELVKVMDGFCVTFHPRSFDWEDVPGMRIS
ncbi:hypothetical protein IMSHALPRED_003976 [Imshaugia aleurites]|uniref:Uncharacterized protein n=1 Tax=Imshaugia aleurites TaxID=172621 RepID=A0A8H3I5R5_9LECA|nr:hypothetical protein IMSHALPRED_003976 [Imshaugia aleurites]